MDVKEAQQVIDRVTYRPGWRLELVEVFYLGDRIFGVVQRGRAAPGHDSLGRYAVQVAFQAPNADNPESGELFEQRGRKWLLWDDISRTQLVTTCAQAINSAETHEFREFFRYRDAMVLNPHFDIEELVVSARDGSFYDSELEDANSL
jgi:hypothetical protein